MKSEVTNYLRPEMTMVKGYAACKSPDVVAKKLGIPESAIVKLDANENNYGPSPRVATAIKEAQGFHIYPDAAQTEMRFLLAQYAGKSAEQIVLGAGSDQLIELLIKLFAAPGEEIICMSPTFPMYRFYADLAGVTTVDVPRDESFLINVTKIAQAVNSKTKLVFLANPNNPTGTMTERKEIIELAKIGVPLVVDEAYFEFTGESAIDLMNEFGNIMILRTFSKWSGLAGLRIGYGVFPHSVAKCLHAIRDPYNVNVAALIAAKESLLDLDYLLANVRRINNERERMLSLLTSFKWIKAYPSKANFILCDLLKGSAREVQQLLEDRGILVRCYADARIKNAIRFSIGRPEEDDKLLRALEDVGRE